MKKTSIVLSLLLLLGSCSDNSGSTQQSTTTIAAPTTTEPEKVKIPDLTLLDKRVAMNMLVDMGLRVELQERMSNDDEGTIVGSSPSFGKSVEPGSRVVLYYAIPKVYELSVTFEIRDGLAKNLGDGKCNLPRLKVQDGQSFVLLGPEGQQLGSTAVPDLMVDPLNPKICTTFFTFSDLPEVATYRLQTGDGYVFPSVSFSDLEQSGWYWGWYWSKT